MLTADGRWHELTTATFSHDATRRADRLDRFMGVESASSSWRTAGLGPRFTSRGKKFERPATGKAPADIGLPR